MISKVISIKNNPATFYILLSGITFFIVFYIYCVNAAVRNVVLREEVESKISSLHNTVSELEFKYMSSENTMTLEKAKLVGLLEPSQKVFISKNNQNKALSLYNTR